MVLITFMVDAIVLTMDQSYLKDVEEIRNNY
jgi:hypothetical protein